MSNVLGGVRFSLISLENFEDRERAERILNVILNAPNFALPQRYGPYQPVRGKIDPHNTSPILDLLVPEPIVESEQWIDTRLQRTKVKVLLLEFCPDGDYLIDWIKGPPSSFPSGHVSGGVPWAVLREESDRLDKYLGLVKSLIPVVNPVYGDIDNTSIPGWDTPLDLEHRLPNVPWVSIYGKPYIEMFGREKILSAPFYKIEELSSGHFFLQAAESITEPVPEFVRAAIRKHLGEDSFIMSGVKWRYRDGRAPKFNFNVSQY